MNIPQDLLTCNEVSGITFHHPNINLLLASRALEHSLGEATSGRLPSERDAQGSTPTALPPVLVIKSFSHRQYEAETTVQPLLQAAPISEACLLNSGDRLSPRHHPEGLP